MELYIGTSGYGYKPWKGKFYPKDLPDNKMLNYYSQHFPAVEINNTFYAMPVKSTLQAWIKEVPKSFKFIIKSPAEITHRKRLKNCEQELKYFLETSAELKKNLSGFLFQLPPNLKKDSDVFSNFLKLLPKKLNAAFEFRHESWFDEEVYDLLRKKDFPLCIADTDEKPVTEIISTSSTGYLRLRKENYEEKDILEWINKIKAQNWKQVFIFFKHEDKANGPRFAKQLMELYKAG